MQPSREHRVSVRQTTRGIRFQSAISVDESGRVGTALLAIDVCKTKSRAFAPAFACSMDARVKPGHDEERAVPHNTRLLSFTFSASRYTLLPISLNLALICAIPSSITPDTDNPTPPGSFSVAA
jgi:hypothetical protein